MIPPEADIRDLIQRKRRVERVRLLLGVASGDIQVAQTRRVVDQRQRRESQYV